MVRSAICIPATILLASALFASEAEAFGGGGFDGQAGRSGGNTLIVGNQGRFGQPHQREQREQQRLPSYPSYLPYASCWDLWYTVPGYRSPMDCPPGT
jgi:hypothetical protein